ncbi:MAG: AAA family ATPase [Candidatus Hydrogenedentota bacterium]
MLIKRQVQLPKNKNFFLFGPRQTGKSTLLKHTFSNKRPLYYDILKSEIFRKLAANPEVLRSEIQAVMLTKKITHVIIDEVQKIPGIMDELQSLIDSKIPCNFIISGSSPRKLKRAHANMLAGRAWTFHLYPFTYFEIKDTFELNRVLQFGSIPPIYCASSDTERYEILNSYVDTYIKEEVEIEADIRNIGGFLRFLPMAASQNGEVLNFSNIARETGVKYNSVREYYKILEDTLIGFYLLPYGRSIRKKMTRHPKFYLFDTGIVNALNKRLQVTLEQNSYEFGRLFEQFLVCEIIRMNNYRRADFTISFYRTERGVEVDCIIETPKGKIVALEIKSTRNPDTTHCSGLISFKEKVKEAELILACRIDIPRKLDKVLAYPWETALEYISTID